MRKTSFLWLGVCGLVVACASSGDSPSEGDGGTDGGKQDSGVKDGGKDARDGAGRDTGIILLDGGSQVYGCSADLMNVVDANGEVVKQCAPQGGCKNGQCVAPCEAAASSKGNVGCDFVVATPSFYTRITQPCFAVFLANNWPAPVQITVDRAGTTHDVTKFARVATSDPNPANWPTVAATGLEQNQVAVLFMSSDPNSVHPTGTNLFCPVPAAVSAETAVKGTGAGEAWHITTNLPVSAYDIHPYGGAKSYLPSAQMLLPTSAWSTNYVAVVPTPDRGPLYASIVAMQDDTQVTIVPTVDLPAAAGVVPAAPAGQPTSFTLRKNQFVQWEPSGQMSGSIIASDKPVAFMGGTGYLCLGSATSSGGGCDSGHQLIPPVSALASHYVGVDFPSRSGPGSPESIPYRIVGVADGTTLTYDPPVDGAPTDLALGQVVDFESRAPFVVQSQDADHPFYLSQFMPGSHVPNNSGKLGDEEFVNILPPAQFLSKYVFFTDPTYPTTNLVFTRVKTSAGFHPVKLACMGEIGGWKPVGTSGEYEIAHVNIVNGGSGVGGCSNGPQSASSDGLFGLMVWGLSRYASYAYPAGGNTTPINTVVVPPTPR